MQAAREVVELAEAWRITPTELSLAWAIGRACNASVIIGTTTTRQVDECVGAALLDLPDELVKAVDAIHEMPQPVRVLRGQSGVSKPPREGGRRTQKSE